MKKKFTLYLMVSILASLQFANAGEKTFNFYTKKLAKHPFVVQSIEKSKKFNQDAFAKMGLPDPKISIGVDNVPVNDPSFDTYLPSSKTISYSQMIPNFEKRKLLSSQQKILSKQQKVLSKYRYNILKGKFINTMFQLQSIKKLIEISEKKLKLFNTLEQELKAQIEAGNILYDEFSKLEIKKIETMKNINNYHHTHNKIENYLVELVDEIPNINIPLLKFTNFDTDIKKTFPILISMINLNFAKKNIEISNANYNTNYGFNIAYKKREEGKTFKGDDWVSMKLNFSIPLWSNSNQKPKINAATHDYISVNQEYKNQLKIWTKKLKNNQSEIKSIQKNIKLLNDIQNSAIEVTKTSKQNYEAGIIKFKFLINSQIKELEIQKQLLLEKNKYMESLTNYNNNIIGGNNYAEIY